MLVSDRAERIKIVGALAEIFERQITEGMVEAYLQALGDLSTEELRRACGLAIRECRYFPRPVELRELIQSTVNERAERAWVLFVEACHKSGDFSVYFQDNLMAHAMLDAFGGWIPAYEMVVRLSPEMLASKRKEFISAYMRHLKHPPIQELRMHAGRHELQNRENSNKWDAKWREIGVYPISILRVSDKIEIIGCQASIETHLLEREDLKRLGGQEGLTTIH